MGGDNVIMRCWVIHPAKPNLCLSKFQIIKGRFNDQFTKSTVQHQCPINPTRTLMISLEPIVTTHNIIVRRLQCSAVVLIRPHLIPLLPDMIVV